MTIKINGSAITHRVTIREDSDDIVEIYGEQESSSSRRKRTLFEQPD